MTIYLVLFGMAVLVKNTPLLAIALIAISIYATAYSADIIRGGFESVPRQQIEAARAMNFGRWRTLIYVIIPQSWPVILPPAMVFMVAFVKDTALLNQLGVFELTFFGARSSNNQGYSGGACVRHRRPALFRHVLSAHPPRPMVGETACHTSKSETSAPATVT